MGKRRGSYCLMGRPSIWDDKKDLDMDGDDTI